MVVAASAEQQQQQIRGLVNSLFNVLFIYLNQI